jgi:hypothetical protein
VLRKIDEKTSEEEIKNFEKIILKKMSIKDISFVDPIEEDTEEH